MEATEQLIGLQKDFEILTEKITENTVMTKTIHDVLIGDGKNEGVVTSVVVLKESNKRIWWWLGAISTGMMGAAIFVLRAGLLAVKP